MVKFCPIAHGAARNKPGVFALPSSSTALSTGSVGNPRRTRKREFSGLKWLSALLACGCFLPSQAAEQTAAAALRIISVPDGRCHILSEGGQLTVLHNDDPSRTIRYRLVRLFVDRPQGLMDGEIPPGPAPVKLGCSKVGGRAQTWQVKRADFAQE